MTPTEEQQAAIDLFGTGEHLVIEAGAGTGKTSTLKLLAQSCPRRSGKFVAFNKAIVTDAGRKMPANVTASTAHSLAFQAVGKRYAHRLGSARMKSMQIARELGIDDVVVDVGGTPRRLAPGYLAGHVMRAVTRFCQTADPEPTWRHFPRIDAIDPAVRIEMRYHDETGGARTKSFDSAEQAEAFARTVEVVKAPRCWPETRRDNANNRDVAKHLEQPLRRAWKDLQDLNGRLPYKHEHYLKAWQLSDPTIYADFVLFDEAQDANPVMLAVVAAQTEAQRIYVGDANQQIYEWTGAVNALDSIDGAKRTALTQSFRFGPLIAATANLVLDWLESDLRIRGTDSIESDVRPIANPDVILCRTNACAVETVLGLLEAGRQVALVGGAADVVSFARAAEELQTEGQCFHPELSCFDSWAEVQDYVANDPQGSELKLLVGLIDDYSTDTIIDGLSRTTREDRADIVISTSHKAKGREWAQVRLAGDFPDGAGDEIDAAELRLLYVAVTRARMVLDNRAVPLFFHSASEVS
jgi:superfamily I DNA/RNA helicase